MINLGSFPFWRRPPSDQAASVESSAPAKYDCGVIDGPTSAHPESKTEVLKAAGRASVRSAILVHAEMKRGLDSLATIASTALWIGVFGTLLGINNSFQGLGTSYAAAFTAVTKRLSESLAPTVLGLIVALAALCFYKYLLAVLETFDEEMESASLQLVNDLGRLKVR